MLRSRDHDRIHIDTAMHAITTQDPDQFDPTQGFNIGISCTQPAIVDFDHGKTAVIVDHEESGTFRLSYRELNALSNQFAHALSSLSIKKSQRVMLWLPNVSEFPVAFFGTLKLGAIAVPTSVMLTPDEIRYLVSNSGARCMVTTQHLYDSLSQDDLNAMNLAHVIIVDSDTPISASTQRHSMLNFQSLLAKSRTEDLPCTTIGDDPAYLVYTSGTTGYPKGVLHAHRAVIGRLPAAKSWFYYRAETEDRVLHSGKFNWTYVLGTALMDPLLLGKTVIVYEGQNDASVWPSLIAKHSASIFIGVPTIFRQILAKTESLAAEVPSLRHCMSAGEALPDEILSEWNERFGQNIYEAIGMSECSYYLSQHPSRPVKPGSAGQPQPGHKISLLNESLEPVSDEEEGMLCIQEDDLGLFIEYWQLPEETQASRKHGYFLTGDFARRDKDGDFWFLGRKDDIINTFGYRVSPMEIERVMKSCELISDCVALQEEVATDKHIVTLCVIAPPHIDADEEGILNYARQHLARYKAPRRVVFLDTFPRTRNGKVLRKALQSQL